ncbi:hypothetical protein D3C72_1995590 [compost metagenome]
MHKTPSRIFTVESPAHAQERFPAYASSSEKRFEKPFDLLVLVVAADLTKNKYFLVAPPPADGQVGATRPQHHAAMFIL